MCIIFCHIFTFLSSSLTTMDARASFDAWIAETAFIGNADAIFERFSKVPALEMILTTVEPDNLTLANFIELADPITFTTEGSPRRWVPIDFLYGLKDGPNHKKVVVRALKNVAPNLLTSSDIDRDAAFAIYCMCTDIEEPPEDDIEEVPCPPLLDDEPAEISFSLQDEEHLSIALVDAPPRIHSTEVVSPPIASLTPLIIDGEEYLMQQDVLELLNMKAEELYCALVRDAPDDFVDFAVQEIPPQLTEVARFDGSNVDNLSAMVYVQQQVEAAAPEYMLSDEEFKKFQESLFGPKPVPSSPIDDPEAMHSSLRGHDLTVLPLQQSDQADEVHLAALLLCVCVPP